MTNEEWALVKPTLGASEYMPVRIVRRGRRFTWVTTMDGREWRYTSRGLWDGFHSYEAASAEIDAMRAASTAHMHQTRPESPARASTGRRVCRHEHFITMPAVAGRTTTLCRCRTCNRDFDYHTGYLVTFVDGAYRYESSKRPVP